MALGLLGCRRAEPVPAPSLRVIDGATVASEPDLTPVELVLASVPAPVAAQLQDALIEMAQTLLLRGASLDLGLDDDPVDAPLRPFRPWAWPAWDAALLLARNRYPTPDGLVLEVISSPAGPAAVPAWQPPAAPSPTSRWRWLAWPLARALWLRTASASATATLAAALRERLPRPESPQALVLDAAALHGAPARVSPELTRLARRLASRASSELPGPLRPLLASLASEARAARLPFLSLSERDLLVVPRQGQIARAQPLLAEARAAHAGATDVRWLGPDQPTFAPLR